MRYTLTKVMHVLSDLDFFIIKQTCSFSDHNSLDHRLLTREKLSGVHNFALFNLTVWIQRQSSTLGIECAVTENIHAPPTEGIEISWGMRASGRSRNIKKCMKLYWNFHRGGEVLEKIPSVGDVWIFSGTTQLTFSLSQVLGADLGGRCRGCEPPPPSPSWDDLRLSNTTGILQKEKNMWFIGVEVVVLPLLKKILDPPLSVPLFLVIS